MAKKKNTARKRKSRGRRKVYSKNKSKLSGGASGDTTVVPSEAEISQLKEELTELWWANTEKMMEFAQVKEDGTNILAMLDLLKFPEVSTPNTTQANIQTVHKLISTVTYMLSRFYTSAVFSDTDIIPPGRLASHDGATPGANQGHQRNLSQLIEDNYEGWRKDNPQASLADFIQANVEQRKTAKQKAAMDAAAKRLREDI